MTTAPQYEAILCTTAPSEWVPVDSDEADVLRMLGYPVRVVGSEPAPPTTPE